MIIDDGPLMFINSVTSGGEVKTQNQKIYDSREIKVKNTFKPMNALEEKKLNNIIQMYQKGRPVLCDIICESEELTGTPFKKDDNVLSVYISESETKDIELKKISRLVIVKF